MEQKKKKNFQIFYSYHSLEKINRKQKKIPSQYFLFLLNQKSWTVTGGINLWSDKNWHWWVRKKTKEWRKRRSKGEEKKREKKKKQIRELEGEGWGKREREQKKPFPFLPWKWQRWRNDWGADKILSTSYLQLNRTLKFVIC